MKKILLFIMWIISITIIFSPITKAAGPITNAVDPEPPVNVNLNGRTIYLDAITITAKGSVGSKQNPIFADVSTSTVSAIITSLTGVSLTTDIKNNTIMAYCYVAPITCTSIIIPAEMSITITPESGHTLFLDKVTLTRQYYNTLYIGLSTTASEIAEIDPNGIGTFYIGYTAPINRTISIYSTTSGTANSSYGTILFREE